MRKFILILSLSFFLTGACLAQAPDTLLCDVPNRDTTEAKNLPWYGNNDYLENFLDSIGYPSSNSANRIVGALQAKYHVPIKFWVYRSSTGTGGPTLLQLQSYIDNLNRFYNIDNNTTIGFYMKCDIGYIDDNSHLDIDTDLEAWNLAQNHKEKGCINIHITNQIGANGVHYRARFFGVDAIFLNRSTYTEPRLAGTIAHEVGHYFELDHTHQYAGLSICWTEAIDRNRTWPVNNHCDKPFAVNIAAMTGDFLWDTPADHDLSPNFSCNYTLSGRTDFWGDHYETPPSGSSPPDATNLMNYNGSRECRVVFTRLQIGVMLHSIVRGKSKNNRAAWENLRAEYDEYEVDNNSITARPIQLGEVQERDFHQQYNEDAIGNPVWTSCDVDWVRFMAPCTNTFQVFTSAMPGYAYANTRLTLFNSSLSQLAQNDDISPSDQFSSLDWNFVAGQEYFIRVENLSPTLTGYYKLQIGGVFTGPSILCTTGNYSFASVPPGASFNWSVSPSGIATPSPLTGSSTTLTKTGTGNVTLTAQVTNYCGSNFTTSKTIAVGSPQPGPISFQLIDLTIGRIHATINPVEGATSYNWYKNGVLHTTHHGTFAQIPISKTQCDIEYDISVAAINTCGASSQTHANAYVPCDNFFRISPNPATNSVTVSIVADKATDSGKADFEEARIYDLKGNLKKQQRFGKTKTGNIDISLIPNGTYLVEIISGGYKEKHQLIIIR